MGKKTTKNTEKKPSHKIPVVASSKKKKQKQQPKNWKEAMQEKLEGLLQLGLNENDEPVQSWKKEMDDIRRQRKLARKLTKVPLNPHLCKESFSLMKKVSVSAKENVPEAVLCLLGDKLMEKFGRSNKMFVWHLWDHIWLKVHLRCLQEDAGLLGLSDEAMAKMNALHLLKLLLDGVNSTHAPSGERRMKVLVCEFGLNTPCSSPVQDIITELVEKMVKDFAEVAPREAKAVFAKVANDDATAHAIDLAIRGISLSQ